MGEYIAVYAPGDCDVMLHVLMRNDTRSRAYRYRQRLDRTHDALSRGRSRQNKSFHHFGADALAFSPFSNPSMTLSGL